MSSNIDPRPQVEVTKTATANNTAHRGAYVDQSLTNRNVTQTTPVPTPGPAKSGARTLGNIRPFYAEDQVKEIDQDASNPAASVKAHAPNKWVPGRDPYKNQGMPGQDFFDNASGH